MGQAWADESRRSPLDALEGIPPVARIGFGALDSWMLGPWGKKSPGVFGGTFLGGTLSLLLSFILATCGSIPREPCYPGQQAIVLIFLIVGIALVVASLPFLFAWIALGLHSLRVTGHQLEHVTAREILLESAPRGSEKERAWQRLKASLELMSGGEYGGERLHMRADYYMLVSILLGIVGIGSTFAGLGAEKGASVGTLIILGLLAVAAAVLLLVYGVTRMLKLAGQAREALGSEIKFLEGRLLQMEPTVGAMEPRSSPKTFKTRPNQGATASART